jgi:peptidoglycan hydrolase-like protein with peptidoglycan-binding domain
MIKVLLTVVSAYSAFCGATMPLPWTRELYLTTPEMTGNDVVIAQNLLLRDTAVKTFKADGIFGEETEAATIAFQTAHELPSTGRVDESTASLLLELHSADGKSE